MTVDQSALLQLRALQDSYAAELPGRLDALEQLWRRREAPGVAAELHRQTHGLTGSGATFGFADLSRVARQLEVLLKAALAGERKLEDHAGEVERLFLALRQSLQRRDGRDAGELAKAQERTGRREQEVILLESDTEAAAELAAQLENLGYRCRISGSEAALREVIHRIAPLAAVLAPTHGHSFAPLVDAAGNQVPLVFVSTAGDFADRLRAVRAGARACFTRPVDALALADFLDELSLRNPREPYRILIVDDTAEMARYYGLVLENAGMIARVEVDPMIVTDALHEFHPDLVLMDLYMPGCNGLELAAVIRQQQAFVGMPIVFLSAETDADKQLAAVSQGGDDFLNKSISPERLVRSVAARVARSRSMRSLMVRDSLTGLYNHTSTKEQLDRELARAVRRLAPLSFAMIDIDRFKSVNDNYGHAAGDRVIKALARHLKQRLRGSDVIGRYGGEEFAVILPDTPVDAAVKVLNEIRTAFAQMRHHTELGEIGVTFSAGVAGYPDEVSAQEMSEAADKALYRAKLAGRNQVMPAT